MSRECISTRDPLDKNAERSVLIMATVYPSTPEGIASLISRFWSKVNKDGPTPEHCPELGPCWVWTGYLDKDGYGCFKGCKRRSWRAHRFSYEVAAGRTPTKDHLHHACENKTCVNPDHLQDLTASEHVLATTAHYAMVNARKTHCIHGHEFTPENTYVSKTPSGLGRSCRTCARKKQTERRKRVKEASRCVRNVIGYGARPREE